MESSRVLSGGAPPIFCFLIFILNLQSSLASTQLPNTAGIDGELTAKLGVDHFFSLWIVFNNDDVVMSEKPFTILAPKNNGSLQASLKRLSSHPDAVKKLLLDHVVLGQKLDLRIGADLSFTTLGGRTVTVRAKQGQLIANGAKVTDDRVEVTNGRLIIIDNYLFPEDLTGDHSFLQDMTEVLSFLQNGVRVFQRLLSRTNVTKLLKEEEDYTVFVPTDAAFQRWHPIDWGFYPFAVPEFTEMTLLNHFVPGSLRQSQITHNMTIKTLGGKEILFTRAHNVIKANGVEIIKGDTPVMRGNIMFLPEVLFVDDEVVHRLHESHKDKETPPLLVFPWFASQFLSHAFVTLEQDKRFTHITRFLNSADLASHVSGTGYTFFVPTDAAFKNLSLDLAPDNFFASKEGTEVLLSHFVKERLYDKDIKDNSVLTAISNRTLHIKRKSGNGTIEGANIIEKEIFVYNLGTMFFIDNVLFSSDLPEVVFTTTTMNPQTLQMNPTNSELTEETGSYPDILLNDETTTDSQPTTILNEVKQN